jgi:hypothetical protein
VLVTLAVVAVWPGGWWLDPAVGLMIAGLAAWEGLKPGVASNVGAEQGGEASHACPKLAVADDDSEHYLAGRGGRREGAGRTAGQATFGGGAESSRPAGGGADIDRAGRCLIRAIRAYACADDKPGVVGLRLIRLTEVAA